MSRNLVLERAESLVASLTCNGDLDRAVHEHICDTKQMAERACVTNQRGCVRFNDERRATAHVRIGRELGQRQQEVSGERCPRRDRIVLHVPRPRDERL